MRRAVFFCIAGERGYLGGFGFFFNSFCVFVIYREVLIRERGGISIIRFVRISIIRGRSRNGGECSGRFLFFLF